MSEPLEPVSDPADPTPSASQPPADPWPAVEVPGAVAALGVLPETIAAPMTLGDVGASTPHRSFVEREGPAPAPSSARGPSDNTLRLTFTFLSVIAATVVLTWGTLMGPCNAHPPQSQKFKQASFEKLVARPQDAAIEFHHSLFVQDYERARKLASGGIVDLVDKAERECDAACKQQKLDRADRAVTRAILHKLKAGSAWVTVETFLDDKKVAESYEVKRIEQRWLVALVTPPPPPDPPPPPPPVPSVTASAAASSAPVASVASSAPAASGAVPSSAASSGAPVASSAGAPLMLAPAPSAAASTTANPH